MFNSNLELNIDIGMYLRLKDGNRNLKKRLKAFLRRAENALIEGACAAVRDAACRSGADCADEFTASPADTAA